MVRTLRAEELARDVEGLAADDNDLLAVKELLGDDAGQAAKQVALAIDHDLFQILSALPHLFQLSPRPDHAIRQPHPESLLDLPLASPSWAACAGRVGASIGRGEGERTTDSNEDILAW